MAFTNIAYTDDAARMSSSVRGELPGKEKEYKKSAEETLARVGSSVDNNIDEGMLLLFDLFSDRVR